MTECGIANDPRVKIVPGPYDAGEGSMGIKHLMILKKPGRISTEADPDAIQRCRRLWAVGKGNTSKMPKPMHLATAQLAFAELGFLHSRATTCLREISMA